MASQAEQNGFPALRERQRLHAGRRFLMWRPFIVLLGAAGNAAVMFASGAPQQQKLALALTFGTATTLFFLEAWTLRTRQLSARWLFGSLALTLVGLALGATFAGGLAAPTLPLLLAPVVVGFAAFARSQESLRLALLFGCAVALLGLLPPLAGFPALPAPTAFRMAGLSLLTTLGLLAVAVIGMLEAHGQTVNKLDQLREETIAERERRQRVVEHLGAQVAHEVKNPLTAIRGLVQLVHRSTTSDKDCKRLEAVLGEVDRSLDLLREYLEFGRPIGDGEKKSTDLVDLVDGLLALVETHATRQNVRLHADVRVKSAWIDGPRIRDVLLNLTLNGIAAMPDGGELRIEARRENDVLSLRICDTGRGLSADQLEQLGKPFYRGDEQGTGLGVLIATAGVKHHQGELRFESELGKGTRAIVLLPQPAVLLSLPEGD